MKKILLTGGTGFIGTNILNQLSKKFKFTILIRNKKRIINKNVRKLYFKNLNHLNKLLKKEKFNTVIHCATLYKKIHETKDIKKMIEANIHLGNVILENSKFLNFKKFVNFTSVWENYDGVKNNPANLYAVQKIAFGNLMKFYRTKDKNIKYYNLYLSQTFGNDDNRKKLFNILKQNYRNSKITNLASSNFSMNVLNVKDVVVAVNILINKNIKSENFGLLNNSNTNILRLITKFNNNKEKKIKYNFLSHKILKEKNIKYKKLPGWKPKNSSLNDILKYIEN